MKTHTAWEIRFNEPDGTTQYVLATDYAAIVAERDEWKRRCEAMWAWLYHNDSAAYTDLSDFMHEKERQEYAENNQMNTDFAEGRDK